jgi:hypothetical protein
MSIPVLIFFEKNTKLCLVKLNAPPKKMLLAFNLTNLRLLCQVTKDKKSCIPPAATNGSSHTPLFLKRRSSFAQGFGGQGGGSGGGNIPKPTFRLFSREKKFFASPRFSTIYQEMVSM